MNEKKGMSPRARMALIVVSYIVGSILIFVLSFTLSCYFIVNNTGKSTPVATENAESDKTDEAEEKTAESDDKPQTPEKTEEKIEPYDAAGKFPTLNQVPTDVPKQSESKEDEKEESGEKTSENASDDKKDGDKKDNKKEDEKTDSKNESDKKDDKDYKETVVTPNEGIKDEPEEDITVIEIP